MLGYSEMRRFIDSHAEDGSSSFLRKVNTYVPNYTVSHNQDCNIQKEIFLVLCEVLLFSSQRHV
jgi:hypothetical protein